MGALLDTNIFLRLLTEDDPEKAERCERLLRRAGQRTLRLHVSDVCLAEIVWTLESYYRAPRSEIAEKLIALLNTPGLEFSNVDVLLDAVQRYRDSAVDFIDAYHAALAADAGLEVYSYDHHFDKFEDVTRREP